MSADGDGQLTLVSWNIHSGIGTDGRFDLGRVAEVLAALAPAVAALQEEGDFWGRTEAEAHPEWLEDRLGCTWRSARTWRGPDGGMGTRC